MSKDKDILETFQELEQDDLVKEECWQFTRAVFSIEYIRTVLWKIKKSKKMFYFKKMFFRFRNWFRKYDYIIFDVSDNYKVIDNKLVNRFAVDICNTLNNNKVLHIQTIWNLSIFDNQKLNDNIVSDELISYLSYFFQKFLPKKTIKIYEDIIKDNGIEFDYQIMYNIVRVRIFIIKLLLRIYKPKCVFVTAYTKKAEIIAAKMLNIPVIEYQHGNSKIVCYTSQNFDSKYQPDYLLVFGISDKNHIENTNYIENKENIIPIGSYIIENILQNNIDVLSEYKKRYELIVAVSLQENGAINSNIIADFLDKLSTSCSNVLFILIPRNYNTQLDKTYSNIILKKDSNCIQIVKNSHYHLTISSSCVYESASLGVPNIFYNYNNLSKSIYQNYIDNKFFNFVVDNEKELEELLKQKYKFKSEDIQLNNQEYYASNRNKQIKFFINKLFEDINARQS